MVQQAMQYIDQTPDLDTRIELIKTLNNISAGKVNIYAQNLTSRIPLTVNMVSLQLVSFVDRYMLKSREPD